MNTKRTMSKMTSAFSLIELMVVIAIIALLTAIAVPSYKTYLTQSKVTEIFSLASNLMQQWSTSYNQGNAFSTTYGTLGTYINSGQIAGNNTTLATANCTSIPAQAGVCVTLNTTTAAAVDPSLSGITIYWTPTTGVGSPTGDTSDTTITWSCNFVHATTSNVTTATSLLSPGNCT